MQLKPIAAIAVLLLVVASLLVSGCTTSTTNPTTSATPSATSSIQTEKTTFSSNRGWGYDITFPTTWGKVVNNKTADPFVEIALTMSPNNINVVTVAVMTLNTTTGTTLQEFTEYSLKDISRFNQYTLQSIQNLTFAGQPATKVVWTATVPQRIGGTTSNAQIKTMQYYVVHNGRGYVVAYKTVQDDYNTYLTQAQEVINSFTFTS